MQAIPSSQLGGTPPTQTPPEHVSLVVQALPSLHVPGVLGCWHVPPQDGVRQLHVSGPVQGLLSLQSSLPSQVTVMVTPGPSDFVTSLVRGFGIGLCTAVLLPAPKHGRRAI